MAKEHKAKSGRTPEQQAARDARKAAKAAAAANAAAEATADQPSTAEASEPHAESSKSAQEASSGAEREVQQDDDGTLLEIDVEAPEPLSKAELRAAKKRAKLGLPELPPKTTKTEKPKRKDFDDTRDLQGEDEDGEGAREAAEAQEKEVKPERQNSIWIGNLSFRTTVESLQGFLEKGLTGMGVDDTKGVITRVKMPRKGGGKGEFAANKGFAYVDFATPELQKLAVGLSESFFEGRKLLIKLGNDYVANPDARTPKPERAKVDPTTAWILKKQIHPESATLFVGNLPFDATEEALRDFIEENATAAAGPKKAEVEEDKDEEKDDDEEEGEEESGEGEQGKETKEKVFNGIIPGRGSKQAGLRKVRLGAFEDTGRCKGFAFLDFLTPADATKTLVNRRNHAFGGRRLNVQYASESATGRSGSNRDKERPKGASGPRGPGPRTGFKRPREEPEENVDVEAEVGEVGAELGGSGEWSEPPRKKDQRGKRWEATGRPRPGAALAMAKREKVGIVEGQGAKIVFD